jgi:endonuclease/exonuclease/phosphatase family metal-dependent hydrolase
MATRRRTAAGLIAVVLAALAFAAPAAAHPSGGHHADHRHGKPLTVMTRNLYLGADLTRAVAVTSLPPEQQAAAFVAANTTIRAIVDETNFPLRAQRIAAEIQRRRPDLVGLQETALWRHGPLDGSPATVVDYDFLQLLLNALAARGEHYVVADVQQESDVSGPAFLNGTLQNVRLTMRDVVLKRAHDGVRVLSATGANYVARIPLTIAGQSLAFIRGYDALELRAGGQRLRFVDTHLESASTDVAYAQAQELLAGPAAPSGEPEIVVCDCNSDPLSTAVDPGGTHANRDIYLALTGAGFADEWLQFAPGSAGLTDGLSELVNDSPAQAAAAFDHRIDFVFGRRADGSPMPVDHAWVVGKDPAERTPPTPIGRLWPSDHAGVVVRLRP